VDVMQTRPNANLSAPSTAGAPALSVVVPLFNECATLTAFYTRLSAVLVKIGRPYEIVFVDDGSSDGTNGLLLRFARGDAAVRVVTLARNYGQTAALAAGFDHALGQVVVAMDGDLQNEPEEMPRFLATLDEGYDIVTGWRDKRQDGLWTRRVPSRVANWLMSKASGVPLHDFGVTFKAYRRPIVKRLRLHGDMHRFIPALASLQGAKIVEIPTAYPPRADGRSHYGLSRIWRVMADLLTVRFLLRFATRPLHLFGPFAFVSLALGGLGGVLVVGTALISGWGALGGLGPLLVASVALLATGINLLALGLVSELLARVYYDGRRRRIYTTRSAPRAARADWAADLRTAARS
jgi:glycosyltransferase involved in cell wall biosynthesis